MRLGGLAARHTHVRQLTGIKDTASSVTASSQMSLLKTYTAYLRDGGDNVRFEPIMCATAGEAMARARDLLKLHPECDVVEVFFGNERLFAVGQGPS